MSSLSAVKAWDLETDVLIFGFGLAGASAAIEALAADPSLKVTICEKMPEKYAGGNSRAAGQSLLIAKNPAALIEYQRAMSTSNPIPEEMLHAWAHRMSELEPWIKERAEEAGSQYIQGTGFTDRQAVLEFPELGAADAVTYTATILPIPAGVWLAFKANVDKRPIEVLYETPVKDLIQDPDTLEVFGAWVERDGRLQAIKARRGVVLAVGGYEANLEMQRNYCGYEKLFPLGTPGNTGDGIHILQKAGADLWHMRNKGQSGGIWPGLKAPGYETVFLRNLFWQSFSWLEIAADNKRFYNETAELQLTHYKEKKHNHWVDTPHINAGPVHMIFDETTRSYNCLALKAFTWNIAAEGLDWSDDNLKEIEQGRVLKADSIEELAEKMGRDPNAVAAEVERYNQMCAQGEDTDFCRNPVTLQPIATGPFYAVEIVPAVVCTGGGGRRNIESQVLTPAGQPIPRLYEAGELGSMFSNLYQNGSYLTEAMISGRAAGRNLAQTKPWSEQE
ncbi:FAD-binding protein [Alkalimonas sp. MEB108]|uniref:FAD-binding protein n=1 Tax=Alkalimonas cellulosilytica TaxID=3058395 RepID=A0ABU7J9I3_9GAMM|nr:FAD-binding protein [Alkalimonas sp. MEB108]MEE2002928.1 FAD-binding protein [Alkalimonas sp. MEB108]